MRDVQAARLPRQGSMFAMRLMAIGVFVIVAAGVAIPAHAQGHHGAGRGGPDGGSGMMMFGGSPEHIGRSVDHMLDGLNTSEAQRSQIRQIAMAAAADLKTQRDAGRGLHEKGMQIFTAPNVDAVAAESLRQQMSAQQELASKRMLQALLEVAKVLTPEQRAKLGERMNARRAVMNDRMQQERPQNGPLPPPQK